MNGGKGFPGEAGSSIRKDKKDLFLSFPLIREPVNGTQVGSLEDFCRVDKGTQVGSLEDKSRFGRRKGTKVGRRDKEKCLSHVNGTR
jgi:hypothetical protein